MKNVIIFLVFNLFIYAIYADVAIRHETAGCGYVTIENVSFENLTMVEYDANLNAALITGNQFHLVGQIQDSPLEGKFICYGQTGDYVNTIKITSYQEGPKIFPVPPTGTTVYDYCQIASRNVEACEKYKKKITNEEGLVEHVN